MGQEFLELSYNLQPDGNNGAYLVDICMVLQERVIPLFVCLFLLLKLFFNILMEIQREEGYWNTNDTKIQIQVLQICVF